MIDHNEKAAPDGRPAPRGEGAGKIGEPGTRSDGRPCPFQIVNKDGQVLCGYETRRGAAADLELYERSPAVKKKGFSVRRTATALLPGIVDAGQLPVASAPAAVPAAGRSGGKR